MVNSLSIFFMAVSLIISIGLPSALIIFVKKKYKSSLKPFVIGILGFFISSQILENLFHLYVLKVNTTTSTFLANSTIAYAIYGALAAGVFEETGRFICYKYFLKNNRNFLDGISYGIGHGGIEAILIGGLASINALSYALLINSGKLTSILGQAGVSTDVINQTINAYINASSFSFLLTGFERILAIGIHIGLSILVLYAVRNRKNIYYFLAILLHTLVDFPAVLTQKGIINIYIMYGIIIVEVIFILIFAFKLLKPKFTITEDNLNSYTN
ncbi:YhfC family intramembrane metalloprotease [Clostridium sp. SHJSY1]|uniref:YhfC family intramembrane metalloprotease n=1 Tax=Clostridium sp. SHJSY1 TaxID=2942483 RepID=UPI002875F0D1|nr:YhfC family intramembrane metalloprotease [Clostridium sp. SHJSY1]MDS0524629.1 YhfC family intramembrane metalloprotease [Clostridium sp. SHJSY1]